MFERFKGVYRATNEELARWNSRQEDMPTLAETFRLIREICAGNASMIGTVVTHLDSLTSRVRQLEEQNRIHLEILSAILDVQGQIHEKLERPPMPKDEDQVRKTPPYWIET